MSVFTNERPMRAVVIGAGPSGFYAAEALLNHKEFPIAVDILDRLPTPYGLARGGVAPDHQSIKKVIAYYERVANHPRYRFFGGVKLGQDYTIDDLRERYDAIVYAVGCESDRHLGIPGEDLPGVHSATEFVGWYNGHPDHRKKSFELDAENVAVFGLGNVAVDVTRILVKKPEELAVTDIANYAVEALKKSHVRKVYMIGRRGPVETNFTPKEIKELAKVTNCELVVSPAEAESGAASAAWLQTKGDKESRENLEFLNEQSKLPLQNQPRQVVPRFRLSPIEFVAGKDGRLAAVRLEINALVTDERGNIAAKGTGEKVTIECGLAFRAVGYRGIPIPGVPFDNKKGHIPNDVGRVLPEAGSKNPVPGEYVVGWAKRGPSGLIGDNRSDSIATIKALLEDFSQPQPPREALKPGMLETEEMLKKAHKTYVSFTDWKQLDKIELERGKAAGKIREKFTGIDEMMKALGKS